MTNTVNTIPPGKIRTADPATACEKNMNLSLVGACWTRHDCDFSKEGPIQWFPVRGHQIRTYDDGIGPLWIYRDAGGTTGIVRAQSWHDAYGCVLDEILQPIDDAEVPEAYGIPDMMRDAGRSDWHDLDAQKAHLAYLAKQDEYPELVEGYQYQSNATGTGIVSIDLNGERLERLTPELIERMEIIVDVTT